MVPNVEFHKGQPLYKGQDAWSQRGVLYMEVPLYCTNIVLFSIGNGFWSNEGIETIFVAGSDSVMCLSQHLTSFAVLVDTTGYTTVGEE